MTITEDATLTDADRRFALRQLAREWGTPCDHGAGVSCVATRIAHLSLLRELASPTLPAHDPAQQRRCDCLGCLWDEFRGALSLLDGFIDGTYGWYDVDPAYGEDPDPEWAAQFEMEMLVNGLLRDLMYGVTRRVAA